MARAAIRRSGSRLEPDELISAAAIRVILDEPEFDASREVPFRVYAFQRAHWAMAEEMRLAYRADRRYVTAPPREDEEGEELPDLGPVTLPEFSAEKCDLANAIGGLSRRQAEVIRKYYWEGISYGDQARALGVTTHAIDYHVDHARKKLRAALAA
jgi:RNA polymerase sigma factor (sigma-70 family)